MIELIKYNKSGFTLIEITVALLILAVGLVGILTLFPVGFDAAGRAANITKATFLAQKLIEDLKREGYGTTVQSALTETIYEVDLDAPYSNYEYEISADDSMFGSLAASICEVTVTVYWPAGADNQRSVELKTYIAKYEP